MCANFLCLTLLTSWSDGFMENFALPDSVAQMNICPSKPAVATCGAGRQTGMGVPACVSAHGPPTTIFGSFVMLERDQLGCNER